MPERLLHGDLAPFQIVLNNLQRQRPPVDAPPRQIQLVGEIDRYVRLVQLEVVVFARAEVHEGVLVGFDHPIELQCRHLLTQTFQQLVMHLQTPCATLRHRVGLIVVQVKPRFPEIEVRDLILLLINKMVIIRPVIAHELRLAQIILRLRPAVRTRLRHQIGIATVPVVSEGCRLLDLVLVVTAAVVDLAGREGARLLLLLLLDLLLPHPLQIQLVFHPGPPALPVVNLGNLIDMALELAILNALGDSPDVRHLLLAFYYF